MILKNGSNVAPDINAPGGGIASGLVTSSSFWASQVAPQPGNAITATQPPPRMANYLGIMAGVFVLLVILKFASEHKNSEMDPKIMSIGLWNFFITGIMAILFIDATKAIAGKYPGNPVSTLILAA